MPIVVPNAGALVLLPITLGKASFPGSHWQLHLYQNAYTPVPLSVPADFTESSFGSYAQVDIDPSLWTSPTIISNRASETANSGTPYSWTNTGSPQTVYGYYVTDFAGTTVIFAEQFATPRTLNTGDTLQLTLNFTGGTQM